jgi:hypothetical protein
MQELFDLATPIIGTRPTVRGAPYFTHVSLVAMLMAPVAAPIGRARKDKIARRSARSRLTANRKAA